jgi:hypothetical protein
LATSELYFSCSTRTRLAASAALSNARDIVAEAFSAVFADLSNPAVMFRSKLTPAFLPALSK